MYTEKEARSIPCFFPSHQIENTNVSLLNANANSKSIFPLHPSALALSNALSNAQPEHLIDSKYTTFEKASSFSNLKAFIEKLAWAV